MEENKRLMYWGACVGVISVTIPYILLIPSEPIRTMGVMFIYAVIAILIMGYLLQVKSEK